MLGRFLGGELVYAQAPDMGREWVRYQDELAEDFSRRISNDILEARGLPPLPGQPPLVDMRLAAAPAATPGRLPRGPRHGGSKLADPRVPERKHPSPTQRRRAAVGAE